MGWDVEQIGLSHDLPVHDPFSTAEECSKRLKRNIVLVAEETYRYDEQTNTVSRVGGEWSLVELARFRYDDSENYLRLIAEDYQQHQIIEKVGLEKLKLANFPNCSFKEFVERTHYDLYEFMDDDFDVRIFEENIDLSMGYYGRWSGFSSSFSSDDDESRKKLLRHRREVQKRAKLFGCDEIIYCADQGPGMYIYDRMDFKAEDLLGYVKERRYMDDYFRDEPDDEDEIAEYKENSLHVRFSDYKDGVLRINDNEWVDIVFDRVE